MRTNFTFWMFFSISHFLISFLDSASTFRYYATHILSGVLTEQPIDIGPNDVGIRIKKEPVGVAGLIIPWNFPFMMAAWKVTV